MTDPRAISDRILAQFEAAGAERFETDALLPAEVLLDLYGEDIRGRAYVTHDPLRGELMLRPDFTVPVVQQHMQERRAPARYCYAGPVFRQQDFGTDRPSETTQVGYEVFDTTASADVDAEVFAQLALAVQPAPCSAIVGDIGLLVAAVKALDTSDARKAALLRHTWRPHRFDALLERFSKTVPVPQAADGGPQIGLRAASDVAARFEQLTQEAAADPIPAAQIAAIRTLLQIQGTVDDALADLSALTAALPGLAAAAERLSDRNKAFRKALPAGAPLQFRASYGLTAMEYYDGFVFGLVAPDGALLASGGRYDALTAALGDGTAAPAVGGIVRLEALGANL